MRLNIKLINRVVLSVVVLLVLASGIACFFLNEAQRIIVGIALVLGLLNILGIWFFLFKNINRNNPQG